MNNGTVQYGTALYAYVFRTYPVLGFDRIYPSLLGFPNFSYEHAELENSANMRDEVNWYSF